MIVDSSALVAIFTREPERERFRAVIAAGRPRMSAANWVETCLVLDGRSQQSPHLLDDLVTAMGIEIVPVDLTQARAAREAHRRYGRNSGSPARLNYGDCFAYALAITTGDTLLFKGDDFTHTDVRPAV